MAWGWLCWGFWVWSSGKLWGRLGNECRAWGLLVEAGWVTAVGDWLRCAGALVRVRGLASSCVGWMPGWTSFAGSHSQEEPPFPGQRACLVWGGLQQRTLQLQCPEVPALPQDVTFSEQHLQAISNNTVRVHWRFKGYSTLSNLIRDGSYSSGSRPRPQSAH